jgi:serine/threonine protein kinase
VGRTMEPKLIGQTLGKYRILAEIGRGGMGVVYKAHDTTLDCPVAIKVLDPLLARDQEFVQRFLREARATARLRRHPHIVTILDVGQAGGYSFIVMEHLEGRSLVEIIRREGPLPPERVARLVGQVADALDYAHAHGVIHRDVKPGNVIVTADDHAVLTDFGVARSMEGTRVTQSGVMIGTPAYMSPEQVKGQPVGPAADVYALGVVTYEMLGGRPPFEGETPHVLFAHAYEPPPPLRQVNPRVPEGVAAAVHKALAKDPRQRYLSAGAFAEALRQAVAQTEPETVQKPALPTPPSTPTLRVGLAPLWPLFGALGALLLLVALVFGSGRFESKPIEGGSVMPTPEGPVAERFVVTSTPPAPVTPAPNVGATGTTKAQAAVATKTAVAQAATQEAVGATQMANTQAAATLRVVSAIKTSTPPAAASSTAEATPTSVVIPKLTSTSSAIRLVAPNNGAVASGLIAFRWEWPRKQGEIFDVRVCHRKDCQPNSGKTNVAETTWLWCPDEGGGVYHWMVVVIDEATKQEKGPRSDIWQFTWGGVCGHVPGVVEGGVQPTPAGGTKYTAPRGVVAGEVWCGNCVEGGAKIRVRWLWDGILGQNEAFEIKVIEEFDNVGVHVARQGTGAWTTGRECPGYTPGGPNEWCWERDYKQSGSNWRLRFTVSVIQTLEGGKSQLLSPVSNEATFG